jgi:DNA uptake protein ComE-like DNA-binding protein/endonuclease YncB( thermonuclease family)
MWRRFSACEFRIAELLQFRQKIALLALAIAWTAAVDLNARDASKDWTVLQNCRLIANPANDGDSFHVSAGAHEYIFRLYLVDAPETDEMAPGRLVEQAKYFRITVPQAIEIGRAAKEFTRQKLSEPFTVFTHMSDAMGQSRLERFYAYVQTKHGDLGEQLVRNGLARIYGFKAAPPRFRNSRVEIAKLEQLEDEARQEKIGAWSINLDRLNPPLVNTSPGSSFVAAEKYRIPAPESTSPAIVSIGARPDASIATGDSGHSSRSHAKNKNPLGNIDINAATEKELTTVPGIGYVMATRIIAARPFRSADDLKRVSGIGDKKYAQIRPYFQ